MYTTVEWKTWHNSATSQFIFLTLDLRYNEHRHITTNVLTFK